MLANAVIHRLHSLVGLFIASFLRKHDWYPLVAWKSVYREEALKSVLAQRPLGCLCVALGVFSNRDLPSTSDGKEKYR